MTKPAKSVKTVSVTPAVGEAVEVRPPRPFDDLGNVRERVEADVAEFYDSWPAQKALLPADVDPGQAQCAGLQTVYARYRK